jgi:hypothetical protein
MTEIALPPSPAAAASYSSRGGEPRSLLSGSFVGGPSSSFSSQPRNPATGNPTGTAIDRITGFSTVHQDPLASGSAAAQVSPGVRSANPTNPGTPTSINRPTRSQPVRGDHNGAPFGATGATASGGGVPATVVGMEVGSRSPTVLDSMIEANNRMGGLSDRSNNSAQFSTSLSNSRDATPRSEGGEQAIGEGSDLIFGFGDA